MPAQKQNQKPKTKNQKTKNEKRLSLHHKQIRIPRKQPAAIGLLAQNRERIPSVSPGRRRAILPRDSDFELRPQEGPVPQHLKLQNLALTVDIDILLSFGR